MKIPTISPITGTEMELCSELRTLNYRGKQFKVLYHFYRCKDTGEQFTDDKLDEINLNQVYNQE